MRVCRSCRAACPEAARFCLTCGAELPSWSGDDAERLLGQVIAGNFRIVEFVGEGAMGRVYRAEQLSLGKSVAVKLLHPRLRSDASFIRRFENEARAASRLNHPNSIAVIDFGLLTSGEPFIVMEYIRGLTLRQVNDESFPLRPSRVAHITAQIAGAVGEAHALGVLHRDLKPDNVIVQQLRDGRDHVKVVDFGLAALMKSSPRTSSTGQIWGTPQYLSPERLRGEVATPQTDVYAIGAMLYELLTGVPPYDGGTPLEVVSATLAGPPPPPSARRADLRIHPALEGIALRCLERDPQARLGSANELRERLEAFVAVRATDRSIECPRCGSENRGRARFCSECGLQLASASTADEALFREQPTTLTQANPLIQLASLQSQPIPPAAPPVLVVEPAPLVGRRRELQRLGEWLDVERSSAFLVSGEPGIGKSRLAETAIAEAVVRGYRTLVTRPDPSRAGDPWYPVIGVCRAVLALPDDASSGDLVVAAERLGVERADLLGLGELLELGEPTGELERTVRLRELRTAFRRTIEAVAMTQPTLLLVEDVDRFDRPSLSVFAELAVKPPAGCLKILATARETDPVGVPDRVERMQLTPLGPNDMAALGAALAEPAGLEVAALERACAALTPGLPLSAELVRLLWASGRQSLPTTLGELVSSRVTWLAPASRQVLQAAAAIGLEAPIDVLADLASDKGAFEGVLGYLMDQGWLLRSGGHVRFHHDFVEEVVYAMTPRAVLQELHRSVAEALGRRRAPATAIAAQWFRAGEAAGAALEAAGDRCGRRFDDHAAADWYKRAYAAVGDDADQRAAPRVALKHATALRFCGEAVSAEAAAQGGLVRAEHLGDVIGLRRLLATLAIDRAALDVARAELEAALQAARDAGEPDAEASLETDLSVVLASENRVDDAIELLERAVARHRSSGTQAPWRTLARLGELCWYSDRTERARGYLGEALELARAAGSAIGEARVHALLAGLLQRLGDASAAESHRTDAVVSLRAIGDRAAALEMELDGLTATQRIPEAP